VHHRVAGTVFARHRVEVRGNRKTIPYPDSHTPKGPHLDQASLLIGTSPLYPLFRYSAQSCIIFLRLVNRSPRR